MDNASVGVPQGLEHVHIYFLAAARLYKLHYIIHQQSKLHHLEEMLQPVKNVWASLLASAIVYCLRIFEDAKNRSCYCLGSSLRIG